MRGIANIQLIDAKSGVVKFEAEDKNIITNVINDLLNDNASKMNSYQHNYLLLKNWLINSNLEDLFGGIYLLEDSQSLTNIFPSGKVLGIGGKSETNVNTKDTSIGGTYQTVDSGAVSGGYKFIWQWGQNEGNGTIKSICLTPPDLFDNTGPLLSNYSGYNADLDTNGGFQSYGGAFYYDQDNEKLYGIKSDKGLYVRDYIGNIGFGKKQSTVDWTLIKANVVTLMNKNIVIKEYDGYLYVNQYDSTTDVITILKLNKSTGDLVSTITLGGTYDGNSYCYGSFDLNGSYIAAVTDYDSVTDIATISIFDMSGSYLRNFTMSGVLGYPRQSIQFIEGTNEFYITIADATSTTNDYYNFAKADAEAGELLLHLGGVSRSADWVGTQFLSKLTNRLTLIKSQYYYSSNEKAYFVAPPGMLFTINNLATSITKTTADILKITYTLLEA